MAQPESKAAGFSVALRMCSERISSEEGEGGTNGAQEPGAAFEDGRQDVVEEVLG